MFLQIWNIFLLLMELMNFFRGTKNEITTMRSKKIISANMITIINIKLHYDVTQLKLQTEIVFMQLQQQPFKFLLMYNFQLM